MELQARIQDRELSPLSRIQEWFNGVGSLMQDDVIVRAGVRLAFESRHHFPHRKLDPYAKWFSGVNQQLHIAKTRGDLDSNFVVDASTEALVATGIGLREIAIITGEWAGLSDRFDRAVGAILNGWQNRNYSEVTER